MLNKQNNYEKYKLLLTDVQIMILNIIKYSLNTINNKIYFQVTKLKIKYNPFAKAFKDTKIKTEEKERQEHQEVYSSAVGYGEK